MLYDAIEPAAVDTDSAREFLLQATRLASSGELEDLGRRLEQKSRLFREILAADALERLEEADMRRLTGMVFGLRRAAKPLLERMRAADWRRVLAGLLYGEEPAPRRLQAFVERLPECEEPAVVALAGELLHYTHPDRYWLWAPWMWHPATNGGALPLVLQENRHLEGDCLAVRYQDVGRAVAAVTAVGTREGFTRLGAGLFGTHAFLACVYAVYMYTVFRIKLSREFNRILPELPELTRRILGVQKLEAL
jgi:hypothetical protein